MSSNKENSFWTVDYLKGNELINAEKAYYLKSNTLRSPMGLNVASFESNNDLNKFKQSDDQTISWAELISLVKAGW
jgi:nitrous oxide reductase accessory protein NosL